MEPILFEATVEVTGDDARIRCIGDLNGRADTAMDEAYAAAASASAARITLDFTDCGYINSTGIALIVRLLSMARGDGRSVRAAGLTAHYRQIFEITRLADYMEILDVAPTGATSTTEGEGA
jgi:anti-anti-sigma factor